MATDHGGRRTMPTGDVGSCYSLLTSLSDVVVSALLFVGCRLFPPCEKLLSCSFAQNATIDVKWVCTVKHANTDVHSAQVHDHEVVRRSRRLTKRTLHRAASVQHQNQTMVTEREK